MVSLGRKFPFYGKFPAVGMKTGMKILRRSEDNDVHVIDIQENFEFY